LKTGIPTKAFIDLLANEVGKSHVLTSKRRMRPYLTGYRFGQGDAEAVVRPGSLVQLWAVLKLCVGNGRVVIPQASNTGLTGGSTPFGGDYDRKVVLVSMSRIGGVILLEGARQVVCLPGATLNELELALAPHGREPHSVIGSSCLGASVVGGVANNSGGSLIRRGPAYTEMALYARIDVDGSLELVNHLGVGLGEDAVEMLSALDRGGIEPSEVDWTDGRRASDAAYEIHVRDVDSDTPARYNADPKRLFEASGSAGRVIVFAVRLDTFEAAKGTKVFYIGTNDGGDLTRIRRQVLSGPGRLPIAAEYIHRDAFEIARRYGKDTYLLVKKLGTHRLPRLFALKNWLDGTLSRLPLVSGDICDRALQAVSSLLPEHLPERLLEFHDRFEHHLMVKVDGPDAAVLEAVLAETITTPGGSFFECTPEEGAAAFLHRFAVAGAAVRYRAVHRKSIGDIVALDIALPRNTSDWIEKLPASLDDRIVHKLYYGHFFCHVFHQDYILEKGVDWLATEHGLLELVDAKGGKYPAEHNVGHLYKAEPAVAEHYRALDPCNCLNPGIGHTSKRVRWA
jgi:D-lactate dehydrogenase